MTLGTIVSGRKLIGVRPAPLDLAGAYRRAIGARSELVRCPRLKRFFGIAAIRMTEPYQQASFD